MVDNHLAGLPTNDSVLPENLESTEWIHSHITISLDATASSKLID